MNLVIVESPAKAKTIKKYLGKDFEVLASYGHVRDLVPKEGAVDPDNQFKMKYQVVERNAKQIKIIADKLKKADALYLATDPDREGEAISWHLYELLKDQLKNKPVYRVVFNEITKKAVQEAIQNPRQLSMDLVNAQQARRALDYLVGFNLSPLLWKKVRRGLSAGRVQSPALRLIVEREKEIEQFKRREYWSIEADLQEQQNFGARLIQYEGNKLKQFSITSAEQAEQIKKTLLDLAGEQLQVLKIERKQRRRNPPAPFTTSTLQQEAARKLGFTANQTMRIAQQLYEGIDIGQGAVGLISYMRTDSVALADEAVAEIRRYIGDHYGQDNLPAKPRQFKTKAKNAQEAHEAIRPTSILREPKQIAPHLSSEQSKLYELIWKRTLACQMSAARLNTVAVDLCPPQHEEHLFRANGSMIAHAGFMQVYQEGQDDQQQNHEKMLPELSEGQMIPLLAIRSEQHFTEPPPRYTEASLVKTLEELGIGRPSTYASIISTLKDRGYVELQQKRFIPTDVGRVVSRFLTDYFNRYVDYDFTAQLEDELDAIARGEEEWIPLLQHFWQPFKHQVDDTDRNVQRSDVTHEKLDETCPECGSPLSIRLGKHGRFIGCTNYPECNYTRNLNGDQPSKEEPEAVGRDCPKCGAPLVYKQGPYGRFIGCSAYPKCRYIEPLEKPKETGITCPQCQQGQLIQKKSRRGKVFYSCSRYPQCQYALWNEPIDEPCPQCGWPILTLKTSKRYGKQKICPQKECGYIENIESNESNEDSHS